MQSTCTPAWSLVKVLLQCLSLSASLFACVFVPVLLWIKFDTVLLFILICLNTSPTETCIQVDRPTEQLYTHATCTPLDPRIARQEGRQTEAYTRRDISRF